MGQELMQIIYQNYVFSPRFWESKGDSMIINQIPRWAIKIYFEYEPYWYSGI
jgi:hypothetical protein